MPTSGPAVRNTLRLFSFAAVLVVIPAFAQLGDYAGPSVLSRGAGGGAATISVSVAGNGVAEGILPDSIPIGFASVGAGTTGGVLVTVMFP